MNPTRLILLGLALIALSALAPAVLPEYFLRVLMVMGINVILVASLGLSNGFTGVFSLGHVGFVAVGAYASGILTLPLAQKNAYLPKLPGLLAGLELPFLPATLISGILCALLALLIGFFLMRLSGNYVSVATLGFLVIVNVVLINAEDFTRGARTFTGIPFHTSLWWVLGWMSVALLVLSRVAYSPLGRAMRATRDDLIAAQAMGVNVLPTRMAAFSIGAFFAGVGGALYAHYLGSFSPATFFFGMMVSQLTMLVFGGQSSLTGAALGVVLVTLLSEGLRNLERGFDLGFVAVPAIFGASQIALGIIFILVMVLRPSGLLGDREWVLWGTKRQAALTKER